jgi:very-long-chain enoyl-CoA reductase
MITVQINLPKSGPVEFKVPESCQISEIKNMILKHTNIKVIQQRLEVDCEGEKRVVLRNDKPVSEYKDFVQNGIFKLRFKNLGFQISYRTFFYIEYSLPIFTFPFAYLLTSQKASPYYFLITVLTVIHFVKRILEAKFIHIFSNDSVPLRTVARNCFYYWFIFGILIPVEVYLFRSQPRLWGPFVNLLLIIIFLVSQALNFYSHYALRLLRVKKVNGREIITTDRQLPTGLFFDQVISPNYSFEILIWLSFTILFKSFVALFFTFFSYRVLRQWAQEKKDKLLNMNPPMTSQEKEFVKQRYLLFPYIV